jgi:uncharacterized protein YjbI with pentapeptide repeats
LNRAHANNALFELADLKNASLVGAQLSYSNLTEAILTGANLTGANFTGVDFGETYPEGIDFTGVICLEKTGTVCSVR